MNIASNFRPNYKTHNLKLEIFSPALNNNQKTNETLELESKYLISLNFVKLYLQKVQCRLQMNSVVFKRGSTIDQL